MPQFLALWKWASGTGKPYWWKIRYENWYYYYSSPKHKLWCSFQLSLTIKKMWSCLLSVALYGSILWQFVFRVTSSTKISLKNVVFLLIYFLHKDSSCQQQVSCFLIYTKEPLAISDWMTFYFLVGRIPQNPIRKLYQAGLVSAAEQTWQLPPAHRLPSSKTMCSTQRMWARQENRSEVPKNGSAVLFRSWKMHTKETLNL